MITLQDALLTGHGIERSFCCPVHGDSNPSASVNVAKGVWICYACGAKGKVGDIDMAAADSENFYADIMELLDAPDLKIYEESWLDQFDSGPVHDYWLGRFSEAAARAFRLGWDFQTGQATYPLRLPSGAVLGVVRRNFERQPKYMYPKGLPISKLLFGYEQAIHSRLVLVEGAMDVVAVWEATDTASALGMFGSRLSLDQVGLIQRLNPTEIIIATDMDAAGIDAAARAEKMLDDQMPTTSVRHLAWDISLGKDLAEINVTERQRLLS